MKLLYLFALFLIMFPMHEAWWGRRSRRSCTRVHCSFTSWGSWGPCNHQCGSAGIQMRQRGYATRASCGGSACSGSSYHYQACNRHCENGGSPYSGVCSCPFPFHGKCCEKRGEMKCPQFEFVSRSEWKAISGPKLPPSPEVMANMMLILQSNGPECNDKAECMARAQSIQQDHMFNKGYGDIGYNFLIGGEGRVYEGMGWNVQGAQLPATNAVLQVNIGFIGNFTSSLPTPSAIETAKSFLEYGVDKGHIVDHYELFGYSDERCTGDALHEEVKTWPNFSNGTTPIFCP